MTQIGESRVQFPDTAPAIEKLFVTEVGRMPNERRIKAFGTALDGLKTVLEQIYIERLTDNELENLERLIEDLGDMEAYATAVLTHQREGRNQ